MGWLDSHKGVGRGHSKSGTVVYMTGLWDGWAVTKVLERTILGLLQKLNSGLHDRAMVWLDSRKGVGRGHLRIVSKVEQWFT